MGSSVESSEVSNGRKLDDLIDEISLKYEDVIALGYSDEASD